MRNVENAITCPRCKRTSYNEDDINNKYCAACDEYHEFMKKWISVKDRLPETGDQVLFTDGEQIDLGFYDIHFYHDYFDKCDSIQSKILYSKDITHWMPAPELPNDK